MHCRAFVACARPGPALSHGWKQREQARLQAGRSRQRFPQPAFQGEPGPRPPTLGSHGCGSQLPGPPALAADSWTSSQLHLGMLLLHPLPFQQRGLMPGLELDPASGAPGSSPHRPSHLEQITHPFKPRFPHSISHGGSLHQLGCPN